MANKRVLVVFHTSEGQTAKIAGRVASRLRDAGLHVDLAGAADAPHPGGYDGVVVGDPVRYTRQSAPVRKYVRTYARVLDLVPSGFFQVSLSAQTGRAAQDRDLRRLFDSVTTDLGWTPDVSAQLAGALVYSRYGWFKKRMMRRVVARHDGDTDMSRDHEYTDRDAVDTFTDQLRALIPARDGA